MVYVEGSAEEFIQSVPTVPAVSERDVFFCPEESYFYSYCLERFVLNNCPDCDLVIEFGSGDGTPIIHSLLRHRFLSTIHGYELNPAACDVARSHIHRYKLQSQYVIHNQSFFEADIPDASYLIANPPYIPAPDDNILMPLLRGGVDGSGITRRLLQMDYDNVLLMISSYSNPIDTLFDATANGYAVADFMVSPLRFGYYSSEAKVKHTIHQLRGDRRAFYSNNIYFLAGVLFQKQHKAAVDLSEELLKVMTVL